MRGIVDWAAWRERTSWDWAEVPDYRLGESVRRSQGLRRPGGNAEGGASERLALSSAWCSTVGLKSSDSPHHRLHAKPYGGIRG